MISFIVGFISSLQCWKFVNKESVKRIKKRWWDDSGLPPKEDIRSEGIIFYKVAIGAICMSVLTFLLLIFSDFIR